MFKNIKVVLYIMMMIRPELNKWFLSSI